MKSLPDSFRQQILKFRMWEDRQRALLSKCLLVEGLKSMNLYNYSLNELQFTSFSRPFFPGDLDFNISHSGKFVICAISDDTRIGIDIEEIKDIPLTDFDNEFSLKEMEKILDADDKLSAFYSLWTAKEAFLKAIGKGLSVPLSKVNIQNDAISWDNSDWFLTELKLDENYKSHLCTNQKNYNMKMRELSFTNSARP